MGCCCSKRLDLTIEKDQAGTKSLRSEIEYKVVHPETSNTRKNKKPSPRHWRRRSGNWSSTPSSPKPSSSRSSSRLKSPKSASANVSPDISPPSSWEIQGFSQSFIKTSFKENYTTVRKLYSGVYGETILVNDKRTGLKKVLRSVKKSSIPINVQEKYITEIKKFQLLDHPNIIKLYEVYKSKEGWSLIYEFLSKGNLLYKIENESIGSTMACTIMQDILSGLNYCHKNRVYHYGLNLEKIVLDSKNGKINCKIMGFSFPWEIEDQVKINDATCYMAPEILNGIYNKAAASDIWSAGVILYLMIQGKPPFRGNRRQELLQEYKRGIVFENPHWLFAPAELKDLLSKMLEFDHNKRITVKDALTHPWIQNNQSLLSTPSINRAITRFTEFTSKDKIAKALFIFFKVNIADHNEGDQFIEVFKSLDANKDGKITKEELLSQTKNLDFEVQLKLENILKSINQDFIEYSEFVTACTDWNTDENIKKFEKAFKLCDKSRDGRLSVEELKGSIKGISNKEWEEFIGNVKADQPGTVTFDELKKFLFGRNDMITNRV